MSMDTILDNILTTLYNFFVYKVPMFFAPFLLRFICYINAYLSYMNEIIHCIIHGVRDSLSKKYLCFFKLSDIDYITYVINNSSLFTEEPEWVYDFDSKVFSLLEFGHHTSLSHLPYIGASLNYVSNINSKSIGDLSDWIVEQKVNSSDAKVPFQILVSAWKYSVDKTIIINFKNVFLTLITEEGEEITYSLETNEKVTLSTDETNTDEAVDEAVDEVADDEAAADESDSQVTGNSTDDEIDSKIELPEQDCEKQE
jgi:hypothetical protein